MSKNKWIGLLTVSYFFISIIGMVAIPTAIALLNKTHKQASEIEALKAEVRDWQICTLEVVECEYEK